ncbi:uncharacterized protein LOC119671158 [Teleopsis dalmanni]|uniref:uncharacterized protein LOC119671158 n=1 Tax=Teleopsis dalmanni TaxID=139649 RepID=UPI000D32D315|nr:uncharacterized protein LOC119671158 [Teleopsis dalmanni]
MSDLFMDMHHRRLNRAAAAKEATSFNSCMSNASNASKSTNSSYNSHADNDLLNDDEDLFDNILSLKLKKPKNWKWELSTSRSCSNIALPRILLYDHKGKLLVDANSQTEQVFKQQETPQSKNGHETRKRASRASKAATTNLTHSMSQILNSDFNELQIGEVTPSTESNSLIHTVHSLSPATTIRSAIDFYTNDLPDYKFERRSSSLKGVRFQVDDAKSATSNSFHIVDLPTPPSTTTTGTTPSSSSPSGPREKKRYRRSHSTGRPNTKPSSILERFSMSKGRFSSPEYADEHEIKHSPRYYLSTSKAGTLVVQEDSFSRYRRRRKPKNSSSENMLDVLSPKSSTTNSLKTLNTLNPPMQAKLKLCAEPQTGSLQDVAELQEKIRKKSLPIRRYRSDGNILLQKQLSTSEDEEDDSKRNRTKYRKQSNKRGLVTIDSDNGVIHSAERMHER